MSDGGKFSVVSLDELGKLGKPLSKLITVCAAGLGRLYKPVGIVLEAKAQAAKIKIISDAKASASQTEALAALENRAINAHALRVVADIGERAELRTEAEAVREQVNLEHIAASATKYLPQEVSEKAVHEDWIAFFFRHARAVSDETMREVWAQILAGEVSTPGSFSLRTLDALRLLTQADATVFSRLCNLLWQPDFIFKLEEREAFDEYGVNFEDVMMLQAAGLLQESFQLVKTIAWRPELPLLFRYGDRAFTLYGKGRSDLPVMILTRVGRELSTLIDAKQDKTEYIEKILKQLRTVHRLTVQEGRVTEINGGGTAFRPINGGPARQSHETPP